MQLVTSRHDLVSLIIIKTKNYITESYVSITEQSDQCDFPVTFVSIQVIDVKAIKRIIN